MRKKIAPADIDFLMFFSPILLSVIGILFIYSSGMSAEGELFSSEYLKQILWVVLGCLFFVPLILFDYLRLKDMTPYVYAILGLTLLYTRFFGRVVNGSKSWIGIGEIGIQPSEFMKIATILFLAKYLVESEHESAGFIRFLKAAAIAFFPAVLILIQPDFGTALVFFPIFLTMAYIGGIRKRYIAFTFLTAAGTIFLTIFPLWEKYILKKTSMMMRIFYEPPYVFLLMAFIAAIFLLAFLGNRIFRKRYYYWIVFSTIILECSLVLGFFAQKALKEYQVMRLIVFLDPRVDPRGSGWNIIQSITAIGSGGLAGKGFLQGTQSHYKYLPQQSTDFIFSIISEEWGFAGGALVFSLFLVIFYRGFGILKDTTENYGRYIVSGVITMILFHFIVNVGMTMGIMPITGIPLFFLSYGGSSLWAAMVGMGSVLSVHYHRFRN